MSQTRVWGGNALGLALAMLSLGCSDCEFEAEQIDAFVGTPANQVCSSDGDCVVESVPACIEAETAFCGQVPLSRQASQSPHWQNLKADAEDCGFGSCSQCAAALITTCVEGACR